MERTSILLRICCWCLESLRTSSTNCCKVSEASGWIGRINIINHPIIFWSNQSISVLGVRGLEPFAILPIKANTSHYCWTNQFSLLIHDISKRHMEVPQYLRDDIAITEQAVVNCRGAQHVLQNDIPKFNRSTIQ